jgi:hypothetical protein
VIVIFSPHSVEGRLGYGPSLILLCYNRSEMKFIFQYQDKMKFYFGDDCRIFPQRIIAQDKNTT